MIVGFLMIVAPARPKYLPIRKQNTVRNHEKEIVRSIDLSMEWKGKEWNCIPSGNKKLRQSDPTVGALSV